jgi:hypothetical protein
MTPAIVDSTAASRNFCFRLSLRKSFCR